ncbi:uncharacterized protein LOC116291203 [Actinia tenebrosa]|uniref:DNA-3-methyladenine glycosylase n=1 Tax=Actinia tenebrosa TaxID=6105 RepID=A0A6P8HNE8_ACTTE|nr:uncharacterized protein LOC116291203 [Actinia tenebrosa]
MKRRFSQRNCNRKLRTQSKSEENSTCSPYFTSMCNDLKFKKRKTDNLAEKSSKKNDNYSVENLPENADHSAKPTPGQRKKLDRTFYDVPAKELAKNLLGKRLYRVLENGEVLSARIVETEGYLGEGDKACHSYGGKRTSRTEPMFMCPGTAYVYFVYGMHFCLNISSEDAGGAVLIRALEPVEGIERIKELRGKKQQNSSKGLQDINLCNGPSKLCQAMSITKENINKKDMVTSKEIWIEDDPGNEGMELKIVTSTRIGVHSYGQDAASQLLRFYILGNKCVSVRDKKAEEIFE